MFADNMIYLRKVNHLSQEDVAEKLGISRQSVSKWESGETLPDIEKCKKLAEIFKVTLDDLVKYENNEESFPVPPKGKHAFGMVKVGDKGQIVLPARARKMFGLEPGDHLIVLGEEGQGLALMKETDFMKMIDNFRKIADD